MFFYLRVFGFLLEVSGLLTALWQMYVCKTNESMPLLFALLYTFSLTIKELHYIYQNNVLSQFFGVLNSLNMTFSFIIINTILYYTERETYDVSEAQQNYT